MDIKNLKKKNIKFEKINEDAAVQIMESEYSQFRLLRLAEVFETYAKPDKEGQYVNLDFAQLYYLSRLDEQLSHIFMRVCLESELKIKTLLIADANELGVANTFLIDYIKEDFEYLSQAYKQDVVRILKSTENGQDDYLLERFLDLITFGTFEKVVRTFYKRYGAQLPQKNWGEYDGYLISIHNVRNKVAHNIPLLGDLRIKGSAFNSRLSEHLAKSGIKHKTLQTNLSREVIYDLVNILYFYSCTQEKEALKANYLALKSYCKCCKKDKNLFIQNQILVSAFNFFENIIDIFKNSAKNGQLFRKNKKI